ncbi:MAG: HD-GYP domain-containing protein [Anaerovoracaceae bacterium]
MPNVVPHIRKKADGRLRGLPPGVRVVPINASYFHPGMYIDSEIYMKINDTYVLFCKNILIDEELVKKMKTRVSRTNYEVYVAEDSYEEIRQQSMDFEKVQAKSHLNDGDGTDRDSVQYRRNQKKKELQSFGNIAQSTKALMYLMEASDTIPGEELNAVVESISDKVYNSDISIILQCINNIRENDDYLYTHSTNVATLNGLMGRWLELSERQIDKLIRIGLVHDLGKLRIPSAILNKPGALTKEEFSIVQKHAAYSEEILRESGMEDAEILRAVRGHHERSNGTGYPDHLTGSDIPLFARITAVADVYDAMVAKRPYKDSHSPFEILSEFSKSRFSDLDIHVVSVFLEKVPSQFMGKQALLSDGRTARIQYLNPNDFEYPIVSVDKRLIKTNKYLRCVAVDSFSLDDLD